MLAMVLGYHPTLIIVVSNGYNVGYNIGYN